MIESKFLAVDSVFLEDQGLSFDTFQRRGDDRPQFDATLRGGYDGNILGTALKQQKRGSSFIGFDLNSYLQLTNFWNIYLGIAEKYYDRTILSRPRSDDLIHNYRLNSNINLQITPSLRLTNDVSLDHGGSGHTSLNDIRTGILEKDRTWFRMLTNLYFRPDRKDFNASGFRWRLRHQGTIYNQAGEHRFDVHAYMLGLELAYIINPQLALFASVAHVERDWRYYDFDSYGYLFAAGIYGICPCGAYYRFAINHQRRHYDNNSLDDRNLWGYTFLIYNTIKLWQWGIYCNYGFIDPNLPSSSKLDLADAEGHRCGAYLTKRFAGVWLASVYCHLLYLNGEIFNSSNTKTRYLYTGVGLQRDLGDDAQAGINVGVQRVEYDTFQRDSESSGFVEIFLKKNF